MGCGCGVPKYNRTQAEKQAKNSSLPRLARRTRGVAAKKVAVTPPSPSPAAEQPVVATESKPVRKHIGFRLKPKA